MTVLKVEINTEQSKLFQALDKLSQFPQTDLAVALRRTVRKGESLIAKSVQAELGARNITQHAIKKHITGRVTRFNSGFVQMEPSDRITLRDFSHRVLKRGGVSYRIGKSQGRKKLKSAFTVKSIGNRVFHRDPDRFMVTSKYMRAGYQRRQKINELFGPSPWGVFSRNNRLTQVREELRPYLLKQLQRRVRFHLLKERGVI